MNFCLQYISFLFLQDGENMHTVVCSRNSRVHDIINRISIKKTGSVSSNKKHDYSPASSVVLN